MLKRRDSALSCTTSIARLRSFREAPGSGQKKALSAEDMT